MARVCRDWMLRELREVIWRLSAGEPLDEVAAEVGRSPEAIWSAVKRYSPWTRGQIVRWGRYNRRHDTILAYLNEEISLDEAGQRLGLVPHYVLLYMKREGYRERKPPAPRRRAHQYPLGHDRRAFCLHQAGRTFAAIGREMQIPPSTVRRMVHRYQARMDSWGRTSA